ncbi:MAG: hypothetical protein A3J48_03425 [Candidatus Doudnabacteria bacterium RIFCSPHIGHO2_02_FULL_46_11]|uniref:DUF218 domain-containing protein n=1 Tax=Candidatus Doudnabacteria bacterium RIFCSPHIGHO2_02_FULL_46_11 TaxID=1817832 RepID=A0A1F5P4N4_9BACT|nr:MAG: hypothetical protein A3J48_03425 [Candidatus Doudnabacteria bacterium RIFCSPHIGHO2_02_FULL_46_11]
MGFIKKAMQSIYKWRLPGHTNSELAQADVIVALSFGGRVNGPGKSNVALARLTEDLSRRYNLPVIAQWEIAHSSLDLQDKLLHIVRKARNKQLGRLTKIIHTLTTKRVDEKDLGNYLDSYEVLMQAAEICLKQGLKKAIIVAHHDHLWRTSKIAEAVGFEPLHPFAQVTIYDEESVQKYTRSRWRFMMREIPNRLYHLICGLI